MSKSLGFVITVSCEDFFEDARKSVALFFHQDRIKTVNDLKQRLQSLVRKDFYVLWSPHDEDNYYYLLDDEDLHFVQPKDKFRICKITESSTKLFNKEVQYQVNNVESKITPQLNGLNDQADSNLEKTVDDITKDITADDLLMEYEDVVDQGSKKKRKRIRKHKSKKRKLEDGQNCSDVPLVNGIEMVSELKPEMEFVEKIKPEKSRDGRSHIRFATENEHNDLVYSNHVDNVVNSNHIQTVLKRNSKCKITKSSTKLFNEEVQYQVNNVESKITPQLNGLSDQADSNLEKTVDDITKDITADDLLMEYEDVVDQGSKKKRKRIRKHKSKKRKLEDGQNCSDVPLVNGIEMVSELKPEMEFVEKIKPEKSRDGRSHIRFATENEHNDLVYSNHVDNVVNSNHIQVKDEVDTSDINEDVDSTQEKLKKKKAKKMKTLESELNNVYTLYTNSVSDENDISILRVSENQSENTPSRNSFKTKRTLMKVSESPISNQPNEHTVFSNSFNNNTKTNMTISEKPITSHDHCSADTPNNSFTSRCMTTSTTVNSPSTPSTSRRRNRPSHKYTLAGFISQLQAECLKRSPNTDGKNNSQQSTGVQQNATKESTKYNANSEKSTHDSFQQDVKIQNTTISDTAEDSPKGEKKYNSGIEKIEKSRENKTILNRNISQVSSSSTPTADEIELSNADRKLKRNHQRSPRVNGNTYAVLDNLRQLKHSNFPDMPLVFERNNTGRSVKGACDGDSNQVVRIPVDRSVKDVDSQEIVGIPVDPSETVESNRVSYTEEEGLEAESELNGTYKCKETSSKEVNAVPNEVVNGFLRVN
ncbi:uncharacterized protein DDB_G0283697-like [Diaphorina citri]|uniref:Uncharacterized protein DDB_G0283697-like n=1 Tax=Diaphorina citri TaxID=121845 RepID=A0A3Q0IWF3_DIACI|nr:uncharacterized protein DDB_G0283697-like [Diaphorina citri]